jgi:hypothetical protein
MKKFSSIAIIVTIAVGISVPAMAQIVGAPVAAPYDPPIYNYAPASPLFFWSPYSNHPVATGGGSWGYNVNVLRDQGY